MFKSLFNSGILGINARNLLYVKPFNPKKATAFADDKLKTKAFLRTRGIPAAKIYARLDTRNQLKQFDFKQLPDECVLKPNSGFGGEGIIVLKGRNKNGKFLKNGKAEITNRELEEHIEDILDGKFSINGHRDTAFFEQVLTTHESLARFRPAGLPDIRVIVFNLVPVTAMLRVPTKDSDGKGNVHLGGIGIGIDIAKGVTTHAAQYHSLITELPHGGPFSGIEIPFWDEILLICSKIQYLTNIGYLAVDLTIDQNMGPALLEVNARAGLMVQLANLSPLRSRLERVQGLKVGSPEKGVRMCKDLFGDKTKETHQNEKHKGKPVLGTHETLIITGTGEKFEVPCRISPTKERTIFSPALITKLLEKKAAEVRDKTEDSYKVKFSLGGEKIQTLVIKQEVADESVQAIIGKRDLGSFLIDPSKESVSSSKQSSVKTDLRAVDNTYATIDRDLLPIKYLKPINLNEERERILEDKKYNPTFIYSEPSIDLEEAEKKLTQPIDDNSPLGILLEKKRKELLKRIALIKNRGKAEDFTLASKNLYGLPSAALIQEADNQIKNRIACDLPASHDELLNAEEVKERFEEILEKYVLDNWEVSVRPRLVADCTVGGNKIYLKEKKLFEPSHVDSLIAHEIETHVLTAENGDHQPYALLRRGCANYLDTQEGLAIYNQNKVLSEFHERRFNSQRNIIALMFGLEHSFAETRAFLQEEIGYGPAKSITQAISIKRGLSDTSEKGGFTKSVVYFRGLRAIEQFREKGGDLKRLYVGKIALEDLEIVESLPDIKEPLLVPEFLR